MELKALAPILLNTRSFGQRLQLVDDLVLALAHPVVRLAAQLAHVLGQVGVVRDLRAVGEVDAAEVVRAEEVEQTLRVRHDVLVDPREAVLGVFELPLGSQPLAETGRARPGRVLHVDDHEADAPGVELHLSGVNIAT